jgi:hypothetical protein
MAIGIPSRIKQANAEITTLDVRSDAVFQNLSAFLY